MTKISFISIYGTGILINIFEALYKVLAMKRLFSGLNWFCAVATFVMMGLVVTDVALRTFRIGSIPSGVEIVALSVVLITYLPAAPLQQKREHLRVMVLVEHLPGRMRALADFLAWFLFLILFTILLWQGWFMLIDSWKVKEIMIMSLLPVYPVRFCLVLGCLFMVIQLIFDLKSTGQKLISRSTKTKNSSSGNSNLRDSFDTEV